MEGIGGFTLALETVEKATVVSVEGELDMATSPELERALQQVGVDTRLVVDLTRCTFLDSTAIRVLAARAAAGGPIALVVAEPGIRRVLEIAALDRLVELHDTRDSAL